MAGLKFAKCLNSLPGTLQPNTVYMVSIGAAVKMYVTDATGTIANPVVPAVDAIEPLLFTGVTSGSGL